MASQPMQCFQVRMPTQVHAALKSAAAQQERSVNWLINKVLAEAAAKMQEAKQ
jgi:predicted HicB family RNase H-like nuclease